MFESNMVENIEAMQSQTVWRNPWRELVTPQFKAFLDSLSKDSTSKEDTTEDSEL